MGRPKQSKKGQAAKKDQIEKLIQEETQKQASKNNATHHKSSRKCPYKAGAYKSQGPYKPFRKSFSRSDGPEINVHLPVHLAVPSASSPAKSRAPGQVKSTAPLVSTLLPAELEGDSKHVPVWLPETKPFRFLDLPAELRIKIYRYFFKAQHYKIKFFSRKIEALTYTLPDRPRCEDPKLPASVMRRRRQFDYPRRVRSKEVRNPGL